MRHLNTLRKRGGKNRLFPAVGAMALAAGCSTVGDRDDALITGSAANDLAWSFARTAELEAQVATLSIENERLNKRLAELQTPRPVDVPSPAPQASLPTGQRPAQPAVKPDQVIAAARADKALADAPPPVESSPRLVQPTFASSEETIFENEAIGEIATASVMFGVHLASYRSADQARDGWRRLQREHPDELGLLEARVSRVTLEGRGEFLRLIGGGFATEGKAASLCDRLRAKGVFCAVSGYNGERLPRSNGAG